MTMFETVIIVMLMVALLFVELYRTDPRALLHKPSDEPPAFVEIFKKSMNTSEASDVMVGLTGKAKTPKVKRESVTAIDENGDRAATPVSI